MKFFEQYDPAGEQAATQQMQLGQQQAQEQARGSLWKQFEAGRQGPVGGGFGGTGRARQASMGGIHKGLAQGKEQAQLGLQEDIRGMHEKYRSDVMGQVGSLLAADVEAAKDQQDYDHIDCGEGYYSYGGDCYYAGYGSTGQITGLGNLGSVSSIDDVIDMSWIEDPNADVSGFQTELIWCASANPPQWRTTDGCPGG